MATILVTGGAGYLGSHLCRRLAADGHLPVTFDSLATGDAACVRWGPLVVGDLRDRGALDRALTLHRPDAVAHCAGSRDAAPGRRYACDVGGSLALLEAMQEHEIRHIASAGCASVYGTPGHPVDEGAPLAPAGAAATAKTIVERMLLDADMAYGMRAACLRLPPLAGADPAAPEAGRMPGDHLPARAVLLALAGAGALAPGPDFRTSDYLHVADAADGMARALGHLLAGGATLVLNLGTGRASTPDDVLAAVGRATGRRLAPPAGTQVLAPWPVPLAGRAADMLGWRPGRSGLDAIVASLVRAGRARSVA